MSPRQPASPVEEAEQDGTSSTSSPATPPSPSGTTAIARLMTDEQRAELLRVQQSSIHTPVDLVRMSVLGSGACQFELSDVPGKTFPEVTGIILHAHPSNVLWDKPYGSQPDPTDEKSRLPACSSNDDEWGIPREGFAHAGLPAGEVGDGIRRVACATCPYNHWGTGNLFSPQRSAKGKAVANQRRIYIMLEGRNSPVVLTVPPSSIGAFDQYSNGLLDKGIPLQAVLTHFSQHRTGRPGNIYAALDFKVAGDLSPELFQEAMKRREQYRTSIFPAQPASAKVDDAEIVGDSSDELDDEIPF